MGYVGDGGFVTESEVWLARANSLLAAGPTLDAMAEAACCVVMGCGHFIGPNRGLFANAIRAALVGGK